MQYIQFNVYKFKLIKFKFVLISYHISIKNKLNSLIKVNKL